MSGIIGRFNFGQTSTSNLLNVQKNIEVESTTADTTTADTNAVKSEESTASTEDLGDSLNMLAAQNQINLQVDLSKTKIAPKTKTVAVDESEDSIDKSEKVNFIEEAETTDGNLEADATAESASSGPIKSLGSWLQNLWNSLWHRKEHTASENWFKDMEPYDMMDHIALRPKISYTPTISFKF